VTHKKNPYFSPKTTMKAQQKWALVTGGSKGLGKAIAHELAKNGFSLLLVARSANLLEEVAASMRQTHSIEVLTFATDLCQPDAAIQIATYCADKSLPISVLVNNAGSGVWDNFAEAPIESMMQMNALNVDAVLRMTHAILPHLRTQPRAWIMQVGSLAAYQPVPTMSIYGAGKSFIRSFSYALRHELKGSGISVTCLSPGGVWTEFMASAGNMAVSERNRWMMMGAERCARVAVHGMLRGRAEVIPGLRNTLSAWVVRFVPVTWTTAISGRIFKKIASA
jgi:uncharacterized protein